MKAKDRYESFSISEFYKELANLELIDDKTRKEKLS